MMKLIAALALFACSAQAVSLEADAAVDAMADAQADVQATSEIQADATVDTAATTESSAEATSEISAQVEAATGTEAGAEAGAVATKSGYGPIVPPDYKKTVGHYNLAKPFIDQETYEKSVDIYSDQIIAIEALRLEVLTLTQRVAKAQELQKANTYKIMENKKQISQNSEESLLNKAKVDVLYLDVEDVSNCLHRQWDEQKVLRQVLELYCHQFTFVPHLPAQCEPILGSGTSIQPVYKWPRG